MSLASRLKALEARQRCQHRPSPEHFTSVVHVPGDVRAEAWEGWLASQPCAFGALLPERCESPEAWEARDSRHEAHDER